jgi:formylmethanofuran dehydrogenase subunit E
VTPDLRFLVALGIVRPMELPADLAALQAFHGHLGVYVTVGLRMGQIGRQEFGHYKGLHATVTSVPKPPMLCVVDGIQFSSGCTMGKANISVVAGEEPSVTFAKDDRHLRISLRPGIRERIDREMSKEKELEQSLFYYRLPEADLFIRSLE